MTDASIPARPGVIMKETAENSRDALLDILNAAPKGAFQGRRWRWLLLGGAALILPALLWLLSSGGKNAGGEYLTAEAVTGNLVVTVSASGTLQPTKSVDVGSEQSGTLASVLAQENDQVKKRQLLGPTRHHQAAGGRRQVPGGAGGGGGLGRPGPGGAGADAPGGETVRRQGASQNRTGNG